MSTSSSDVDLYSRYVKKDVTLCKLDVNVKNRTAVDGASTSSNLSRKSLKEKVLLYSKFFFENQMW